MKDLSFQEMQALQVRLQEKYKGKWRTLSPEIGRDSLLWLMIELGEAADIIKKEGDGKIMEDEEVRAHFVEEMTDVLMYFNDVMLCYGISVEELGKAYREKQEKNMGRW